MFLVIGDIISLNVVLEFKRNGDGTFRVRLH